MALNYCIAFAICQLVAGFNLGGDGKPFALVFGRHAGIEGGISERMVALARVPVCMVHASLLPVVIMSVPVRFATVSWRGFRHFGKGLPNPFLSALHELSSHTIALQQ
jgi:hypothetical protein